MWFQSGDIPYCLYYFYYNIQKKKKTEQSIEKEKLLTRGNRIAILDIATKKQRNIVSGSIEFIWSSFSFQQHYKYFTKVLQSDVRCTIQSCLVVTTRNQMSVLVDFNYLRLS